MTFSGGDFRFFWPENIGDFVQIPSSWDSILNTGVGKSTLGSLWINSYLNFSALFSQLGLSWNIIGLLFWILPAVLLSFFGAYFLFLKIFPDKKLFGLLSGFIYLGNTYFLMILTGGQLGVALSYSLAPFVILFFLKCLESLNFKNSLIFGLVLSLQVLFDPRIVYITSGPLFLLWIFYSSKKNLKKSLLFSFIIPLSVVVLLHSYWILPTIFYNQNPIEQFGPEFSSSEAVKFFSFANLENSISLLHPNFPENIFGKTYFMRVEFLFLPILAFLSLLFINLKLKAKNLDSNRAILFFAILGLIGVFLAKGANDPFGGIYIWMFNHVPGFVMFRDPTKFYLLIALSYSILIPYSIWQISEWAVERIKFSIKSKIFNFQNLFFLVTVCYLLFLIRPLWTEELEKFKPRPVPNDYVLLKDFLKNQPEFFRTLWIPQWQRFGYFSNTHPAIGREEVLKGNGKKQLKTLKEFESEQKLKDLGVKYIIVPYDSEEEIFVADRKYDEKQYKETIASLQKLPWLSEIQGFGRVHIYEVTEPKDHFWCDCEVDINYNFIKPTRYDVSVQNAKKGDVLVFSEGFNKNWTAESLASKGETLQTQSIRFGNNLNSFVLPENGDYRLRVYYKPQRWVNIGLVISLISFLSLVILLIPKLSKKS